MSARQQAQQNSRQRDAGMVLPLVLVLIIVGTLIVVPIMTYSVAVMRANEVEATHTRDVAAAKAGIRMVLNDPAQVFEQCDNTATLALSPQPIDDRTVQVTCTELAEVGPSDALGFETPINAVAMQLGAAIPGSFSGNKKTSDPVPPYPSLSDPDLPDPLIPEAWWRDLARDVSETDTIWLPNLPQFTNVVRTTSYAMPAAYNCTVYLPGRYPGPVDISTGQVYFASGVYYFEDTVTISGNADVVVGQGLADFGTDCADDIQVGANLLSPPTTFAIDAFTGGATWVFGQNGHLVIDNAATTSTLRVRFNQRYAPSDRAGWTSIMSVNGDDAAAVDHVVTHVNAVDRSVVVVRNDESTTSDDVVLTLGSAGAEYVPSSSVYTDKAHVPAAPAAPGVTAYIDPSITGANRGAATVVWDDLVGQDAGGALIDGYEVQAVRNASGPPTIRTCSTDVVAIEPGRFACTILNLNVTQQWTVSVRGINSAGAGTWSATTDLTLPASTPDLGPPAAPSVSAIDPYDRSAVVSWDAPADGGSPVIRYDVAAYRAFLEPDPVQPDPLDPTVFNEVWDPTPVSVCATELAAASWWTTIPLRCAVYGLDDLPVLDALGNTNLGYRFTVAATNAFGVTISGDPTDPPDGAATAFAGSSVPDADSDGVVDDDEPTDRVVEPWIPTPIVDIRADGAGNTTVAIAGYVAVPMGRLAVQNQPGYDISVQGGVVAGTYDIEDSRSDITVAGSLPMGYDPDIVLQRRVRIVSKSGNVSSIAVVEVNEDGTSYGVNSWSTR